MLTNSHLTTIKLAQMSVYKTNALHKPSGAAHSYHDQMHQMWSHDPKSVDPSWAKYFEGNQMGTAEVINLVK